MPQATALPARRFERYWGTPHGLDIGAVAAAYGIPTARLTNLDELRSALSVAAKGMQVVVARTDREANVAAHDRLNAAVARAIAKL